MKTLTNSKFLKNSYLLEAPSPRSHVPHTDLVPVAEALNDWLGLVMVTGNTWILGSNVSCCPETPTLRYPFLQCTHIYNRVKGYKSKFIR
jgi:hypothetical protein